nr:NAC domain-containing protein [Ipomoea batatas]
MEIPLGLFFQPFDYDLVRFLFEFVMGTNNSEGLIHEEDIFGDKEPWELISYGPSENMAYFLTKLKKKGKLMTARRVERTVGKKVKGKKPGNWHGQDKVETLTVADDDINSNLIGVPAEETLSLTNDDMNSFLASLAAAGDTDGGHHHNISSYLDGVPFPVPVGDTDVSSYLDGVPVPVPVGDTDISSYLDGVPVPVPVGDTDIISSYLDGVRVPVPAGDTDISSYFDGVPVLPVPVGDTDISSYLHGVLVPVPAGDTDMSSYLVDVPMETLIVPGETSAQADRDQDHHMRPGVPVETFPEPGSSSFMDFIFNMEDVTRLIDFDF